MPPPSARASKRAAMLTPSPYIRPPSTDDISDIDTDAKLHSPLGWQLGVFVLEFLLNCYRPLHCVHHTGKLRQQVVPGAPPLVPDAAG